MDCLNQNNFGMTIIEISKEINGNRNTVSKYLNRLESKDIVYKKEIGKACLYFVKDIESKILNFITENPSGVTIKEISYELKLPRDSVRKHIVILENKNKIYSKKSGAYTLFKSSEVKFVPKKFMVSFYKALLKDLKIKFPNNEKTFKEIGRNIFGDINFPISKHMIKKMEDFKTSPLKQLHFEVFKTIFPSYYIFEPIHISDPKIDSSGKKGIFRFRNSEFLNNSDVLYHFYLISGMIETKMSNDLGVPIICNIEKIHISDIKEDSYVDMSIEFK
jgi:predicted transcriptional regulator